jgi:O-antigen/teichoic acid export membrane protein
MAFVLSVAYQIVIARRLGAAAFGLFVLALAISRLFAEGSDLGLDYGVLRFGGIAHGAGDPGGFRAILRPALIISFLAGPTAAGVLVAGSELAARLFGKPGVATVLVPLAMSVPFTATTAVLLAALRALGNAVRPVASTSLIGPGLRLITGAFAVVLVGSATAVAWAYAATECAVFAITTVMVWQLLPRADRQPSPVRKLLRFSIPMSLNRLLLYGNNQTEIVFLGFLAPTAIVGIFGVARRLSALLGALLASISLLFNPMVADLHHAHRTRELDKMFKTSTRWLFTIGLPVFLIEVLFARDILNIFGKDFAAGATALIILAFGQLVNVGTGTVSNLQAMAGYAKLTLMNSVLFLFLSIVLDLLLIPSFGLVGAAIAASTSVIAVNLLRLWQVRRNLGLVPYDRSFLRPIIAAVPAAIVAWFAPLPDLSAFAALATRAAILGVVYLASLFLLGIEPVDREIARAALAKVGLRRIEASAVDTSAAR